MFKGYQNSINSPLYRGFPNLTFGGNTGTAYNFSRCLLWLDASYGTNTVVDGANVSLWTDKINGIRAAFGTAANQPTYVLSDANFNNLPTLNFSGSRTLTINNSFSLSNNTIAIIMRATSITSHIRNTVFQDITGNFFSSGGTGAAITGYGFYNGTAATIYTRTTTEDTSTHIIVCNRNIFIIDGVNKSASIVGDFGGSFEQIGSVSGTNPTNAIIAEILIYDYSMPELDMISLSNNINAKYQKY